MRLPSYVAVIALITATAAYAQPGTMSPGNDASGIPPSAQGQSSDMGMRKNPAPDATTGRATMHAKSTKKQAAKAPNRRMQDELENRVTEQLNRQQVASASGPMPDQRFSGPQSASRPGDCALGQSGCSSPAATPKTP